MTTNKPEVFEVYRTRQGTLENVVLLADYESLQAECEQWKNTASGAHQQLTANRIETEKLAVDWSKAMAECEKLRKDAERIEWLEAQTKKSYTGISFDYLRHVEDGYVVDRGYRFMRRHFASGFKDSLRKAIDAAMQGDNQ